jgi:hypothetical protein
MCIVADSSATMVFAEELKLFRETGLQEFGHLANISGL